MNDDKIKKYINILEESNIDGLEISSFWGFNRIKLSKSAALSHVVSSPNQSSIVVPHDVSKEDASGNDIKDEVLNQQKNVSDMAEVDNRDVEQIKAPLVGTYYSRPKPDEPTFVKIGDKITPGKTLFIIEAMKIFNEIESDYSGTIVDIKIEDNSPVEFDQVVMTISKD